MRRRLSAGRGVRRPFELDLVEAVEPGAIHDQLLFESRQQRCQQPHRHPPVVDAAAKLGGRHRRLGGGLELRAALADDQGDVPERALLGARGQVQPLLEQVAHHQAKLRRRRVPRSDRLDVEAHRVAPVQADEQFLRREIEGEQHRVVQRDVAEREPAVLERPEVDADGGGGWRRGQLQRRDFERGRWRLLKVGAGPQDLPGDERGPTPPRHDTFGHRPVLDGPTRAITWSRGVRLRTFQLPPSCRQSEPRAFLLAARGSPFPRRGTRCQRPRALAVGGTASEQTRESWLLPPMPPQPKKEACDS